MKISSQEEYGLRCLVQVARNGRDGPVPISEIALRENLSVEYVGKLVGRLRKGELVESIRGKAGGYRLSRPADSITMLDALRVLSENSFEPHDCARFSGTGETCVHKGSCDIRPVWSLVTDFLNEALDQVSLADILSGADAAHRQIQQNLTGIAEKLSNGD